MLADAPGKRRPFLKIYLGAIHRHEGPCYCTEPQSFGFGNALSEKFQELVVLLEISLQSLKKIISDKYRYDYFRSHKNLHFENKLK